MSRRGNKKQVDLKLNLAPPARADTSRRRGGGGSEDDSSQGSCVSSEGESGVAAAGTSSMVLAACPRCLMYVMLAEDDPKCPKCKSAVLLDFLHDGGCSTGKNKTRKT